MPCCGSARSSTGPAAVGRSRAAGDGEAEPASQRAGLALGLVAEREAQQIELLARRREQEIALVAHRVGAAMQLRPVRALEAADVMAGDQRTGAEVAGHAEQVGE